jgi:hypothetical protein
VQVQVCGHSCCNLLGVVKSCKPWQSCLLSKQNIIMRQMQLYVGKAQVSRVRTQVCECPLHGDQLISRLAIN